MMVANNNMKYLLAQDQSFPIISKEMESFTIKSVKKMINKTFGIAFFLITRTQTLVVTTLTLVKIHETTFRIIQDVIYWIGKTHGPWCSHQVKNWSRSAFIMNEMHYGQDPSIVQRYEQFWTWSKQSQVKINESGLKRHNNTQINESDVRQLLIDCLKAIQ